MTRAFLTAADLHDLVADFFGGDRRLAGLDRLTGGTKKGVYRLRLDDGTTTILYLWADAENYWPPAPTVSDDPFSDASGAELFAINHAALRSVGVRVPQLLLFDKDGRHLGDQLALVEDAGAQRLEGLIENDPAAAAGPLATLGESLRRMHSATSPQHGRLAEIARGQASQARRPEDIVVDRALHHLEAAAARDARIAAARERILHHVLTLRESVPPRLRYVLVHGELGPDHVLVTPGGEPVMIDFEGLVYFDAEWDLAWLRMRFGEAYGALRPVEPEPFRMELYRYAQVLSLIEGPLRIADSDFPDRQWMLDLAEWNIGKALVVL